MKGYLIGEEGSLIGHILYFENGNEWTIGRDPDEVEIVLEDPMVSRKHVICHLTPEGFILENLSSVNPATQNGKIITDPVLLKEGDIIQIGSTFFKFTEKSPLGESPLPNILEDTADLNSLAVPSSEASWLVKVTGGPNMGAEFYMYRNQVYIIGKDATLCDIILQDLSVSRQHARLSVDENNQVFIEDLGSRNGIFVGGKLITGKHLLKSEDVLTLGTTSLLILDRNSIQQTIISEAPPAPAQTTSGLESQEIHEWKETIIPRKHLILGGVAASLFLIAFIGFLSLFYSQPITKPTRHENEKIAEVMKKYSGVQYSYYEGSGKLFITGHVTTSVEKQEIIYQLNNLPFLKGIEDTIIIDNYVSDNINALIMTNPAWQSVSVYSPNPGNFILRGYLSSADQSQALTDYLYQNFSYIDRLDNQVIVESNLTTQIQNLLIEKGFNNVAYQIADGELVFSGRIDEKDKAKFESLIQEFQTLRGIRSVKNYVILSTESSSLIDISQKYQVMGYSKKDGKNLFIVINGKILTLGDRLDGMVIQQISPNAVTLEKDGLKFKINYNLQ